MSKSFKMSQMWISIDLISFSFDHKYDSKMVLKVVY